MAYKELLHLTPRLTRCSTSWASESSSDAYNVS
nr:MAG TPA: hypothetical protein [Caudoviricetes sp.]